MYRKAVLGEEGDYGTSVFSVRVEESVSQKNNFRKCAKAKSTIFGDQLGGDLSDGCECR